MAKILSKATATELIEILLLKIMKNLKGKIYNFAVFFQEILTI